MEIKVLRLVTGEDIIAQIKKEDDEFVLLNKPQRFIMTQEGVASMPMIPISKDDEYKIDKKHIILKCEPEDEIRNMYNSKFGTGVILPSSPGILER